jgi:hypothetical protein
MENTHGIVGYRALVPDTRQRLEFGSMLAQPTLELGWQPPVPREQLPLRSS